MSHETYAAGACVEYERWASEVRRLTDAICECDCPHENAVTFELSCFSAEKEEYVVESSIGEERPPTLDEIGERVKDCESCTHLVALIRDRMHARQRWGVAKRKVRHAGKCLEGTP